MCVIQPYKEHIYIYIYIVNDGTWIQMHKIIIIMKIKSLMHNYVVNKLNMMINQSDIVMTENSYKRVCKKFIRTN
jgi:uncharacterized protein YrrD